MNKMTPEIKAYFVERYEKAGFRVVPGHWPDFQNKEEVDQWIDLTEKALTAILNNPKKLDDPDDF